jgi:hypothetical protein
MISQHWQWGSRAIRCNESTVVSVVKSSGFHVLVRDANEYIDAESAHKSASVFNYRLRGFDDVAFREFFCNSDRINVARKDRQSEWCSFRFLASLYADFGNDICLIHSEGDEVYEYFPCRGVAGIPQSELQGVSSPESS